jgi:lipopolysaccharide biosynthesis protein
MKNTIAVLAMITLYNTPAMSLEDCNKKRGVKQRAECLQRNILFLQNEINIQAKKNSNQDDQLANLNRLINEIQARPVGLSIDSVVRLQAQSAPNWCLDQRAQDQAQIQMEPCKNDVSNQRWKFLNLSP